MQQHGGSIVNMTADFRNGMPGMAHSGAARAGMSNLTMTAAYEWAAAGVRVNAVAPGWIASSGMDTYGGAMKALIPQLKAHVPLQRLGTEAEVSAAIVFLLSPAAAFISGITRADRRRRLARQGQRVAACQTRQEQTVRRLPSRGDARGAEVTVGMPALSSAVDPKAEAFRHNANRMHEKLAEVRALEALVVAESESKRARFEERGQLLPRERVARLIDRGSTFLELSTLAGLGMHDDDGKKTVMGGGSIAGIGVVAGRRCMIGASDSGIKGGTVAPMGFKKNLRVQQIVMENKLPFIHLVESGGANLMYQSEMFVEGGRGFANQARMSAMGIPQIAVVHGSSTAGGAYLPGLERLHRAGARALEHLPGRPAAGEGCHRRRRHRRGPRRRDDACRGHRPGRIPGRERRPCDRAHARADAPHPVGRCERAAAGRPAAVRRRRADGHRAHRRPRTLRRARADRACRRRLALPRVQGGRTPPTRSAATR